MIAFENLVRYSPAPACYLRVWFHREEYYPEPAEHQRAMLSIVDDMHRQSPGTAFDGDPMNIAKELLSRVPYIYKVNALEVENIIGICLIYPEWP